MTKKDFIIISQIVGGLNIPDNLRHIVAQDFAQSLSKINERFDFNRFVTACQKEIDKNQPNRYNH